MAKKFTPKRKATKEQMGSGLEALLGGNRLDKAMKESPVETVKTLAKEFSFIPIVDIEANPDQPRREFDEEQLEELANSIDIHGIIQPITVRWMGNGKYQIISGERRFRASKKAKKETIPAFIRTANDTELLEMGLIENIQREDLNPMEIAFSYLRLKQMAGLTQKELSKRVKAPRSTVANYLGILETSFPVQQAIKDGRLSFGAAKSFAGIKDKQLQELFLKEILEHPEWTTREIEKEARTYKVKNTAAKPKQPANEDIKMVKEAFQKFFGTKQVKVSVDGKDTKSGSITIKFANQEQLEQFYKSVEL